MKSSLVIFAVLAAGAVAQPKSLHAQPRTLPADTTQTVIKPLQDLTLLDRPRPVHATNYLVSLRYDVPPLEFNSAPSQSISRVLARNVQRVRTFSRQSAVASHGRVTPEPVLQHEGIEAAERLNAIQMNEMRRRWELQPGAGFSAWDRVMDRR